MTPAELNARAEETTLHLRVDYGPWQYDTYTYLDVDDTWSYEVRRIRPYGVPLRTDRYSDFEHTGGGFGERIDAQLALTELIEGLLPHPVIAGNVHHDELISMLQDVIVERNGEIESWLAARLDLHEQALDLMREGMVAILLQECDRLSPPGHVYREVKSFYQYVKIGENT